MTKFDAATVECQQLAQAYYQLPTIEQKIIQLFAIIYEPINRTAFLTCLNQSGCRNENGKAFNDSTLKLHIDKLLKAGLLIQEKRQGPQCHRLLTEIATRHAVKIGTFEAIATTVQQRLPITRSYTNGPRYFQNQRQFMRELRIGIYRQDLKFMNQVVEDYYKYANKDKILINDIFAQIFHQPFDADWFITLNHELYETALLSILGNAIFQCYPVEEPLAMLKAECTTSGEHCSDYLQLILTEQLLLRGCLAEAQQALERISEKYQENAAPFWAWLYFFRGENEKALAIYTKTLKELKKASGKNPAYFKTIPGIFFILTLLKDGSLASLKEAEEYVNLMYRKSEPWLKSIYPQLKNLLQVQQGNLVQKNLITSTDIPALEEGNSLATLLCSLCLYWVDADRAKKRLPKLLEALYQQAVKSNYHWLAMESAELLSRLKPRSTYSTQAEIIRADSGIQSIVDTIRSSEPWELCLNALANIYKEPVAPVNTQTELRLAWFITFSPNKYLLQPREQKMSKNGWGKGRPIALKRLSSNLAEFDYITPQDMRVCSYIESYFNGSYGFG